MTHTDAIGTTGFSSAKPRGLRRVGAVLAGLVTIFATTTAVDVVLHVTDVYPPMGERMSDALFVLATAYRIVFGVLGCWVAARIAPDRPMRHAMALGWVGVAISTAGAFAMGDQGPLWYALAVIGISLPCAYVGGRLAQLTGSVKQTE